MGRQTRGLITLNAALLAVLAAVALTPGSDADADQGAQPTAPGAGAGAAGARARGSYTMISPRVIGGPEGALFVIDAANRELAAMRFDQGRRELIVIGRRDLSADAAAAASGVRTR